MAPLAIIEHFDIFKYPCLGLPRCVILLQRNSFGLSGMKEALGYSVVPTIALAAHTGLYGMLGQELSITVGSILAATVRRHDQSRRRPPLGERHRHGLVDQFGPPLIGHRPPDH